MQQSGVRDSELRENICRHRDVDFARFPLDGLKPINLRITQAYGNLLRSMRLAILEMVNVPGCID